MKVGDSFEYEVTEIRSDMDGPVKFIEKYVIASIDGENIVFDHYRNGEKTDGLEGSTQYLNGIVRMNKMTPLKGKETVTIRGREMTLDYHTTGPLCGGGVEFYCMDGVVYRYIQHQMWSGGVMYHKTMDLIA